MSKWIALGAVVLIVASVAFWPLWIGCGHFRMIWNPLPLKWDEYGTPSRLYLYPEDIKRWDCFCVVSPRKGVELYSDGSLAIDEDVGVVTFKYLGPRKSITFTYEFGPLPPPQTSSIVPFDLAPYFNDGTESL